MWKRRGIVESGTIDFFGHPKTFSYKHSECVHGNVSWIANKFSYGLAYFLLSGVEQNS
jgi:hypothetical protein